MLYANTYFLKWKTYIEFSNLDWNDSSVQPVSLKGSFLFLTHSGQLMAVFVDVIKYWQSEWQTIHNNLILLTYFGIWTCVHQLEAWGVIVLKTYVVWVIPKPSLSYQNASFSKNQCKRCENHLNILVLTPALSKQMLACQLNTCILKISNLSDQWIGIRLLSNPSDNTLYKFRHTSKVPWNCAL